MSKETDREVCGFCATGFPASYCWYDNENGCFSLEELTGETLSISETLSSAFEEEPEEREYKDARSTGRKRAARLYKIEPGQVCEWAWHKFCGGGIKPIVGCGGRPASHIHHGPDKSTFNNDRSNISLVCEYCHNRWHVANDPFYQEPRPANGAEWLPSSEGETCHTLEEKVRATKEEILMNELLIPEGGKDKKK